MIEFGNKKGIGVNLFKRSFSIVKSKAFTLAEVLITLGIIGVVAALTIPTLVSNYQEKSWNTSALVFEKKLDNILSIMNAQELLEECSTTEDFVQQLSKNYKVTKICQNYELTSCFPKKFIYGFPETEEMEVSEFTDSSTLKKESYDTNTLGLQFADGVTAIMAFNPSCFDNINSSEVHATDCLSMIYDTSGYAEPNTVNKDVRMINVDTLHAFKLNGTKYSAVFPGASYTWNACNSSGSSSDLTDEMVMNRYGIDKCNSSDDGVDYWAGAAIACGGSDNLPTPQNLAEIANYVYNRTDIGADTNLEDLTFDTEKATSLGLALEGPGKIMLWTKVSPVNLVANVRTFGSNSTKYNSTDRRYSSPVRILCVIK